MVSLKCAVVGTPAPVVTWTLDGSSLPVDDRIVISNHIAENGDIISMVNVTGIQLQDGGLYRCTAENEHGADLQEARIDIYGRIQNYCAVCFIFAFCRNSLVEVVPKVVVVI